MKKIVALALTAVLCMACAVSLAADFTLVEQQSVENTDFILFSDLLKVADKDGCRIKKLDGEFLTPDVYRSVSRKGSYLEVSNKVNNISLYGLLDLEGNMVIPIEYPKFVVYNDYWAVGIRAVEATADKYDFDVYRSREPNAYMLIDTVDVYSLKLGKCVASLPRANYMDSRAVGSIINIQDRATGVITSYDQEFNALGEVNSVLNSKYLVEERIYFRENGQFGLKDTEGNVLMKPSFATVYAFVGNYATVSDGKGMGLIDWNGNVVLKPDYTDILRGENAPYMGNSWEYNVGGYFLIKQGDKLGYVNEQGEMTCAPKYSENLVQDRGASMTYTDLEGKFHIVAADGVETVIEGYDKVTALEFGSGKLYEVCNADDQYGVIDWHGEIVLPLEYDAVDLSGSGRYLIADIDYKNSVIYEVYEGEVPAPTPEPTAVPTPEPTAAPTAEPTAEPAQAPAAAAPAAQSNFAVAALLDAAMAKLETDPANNKDAVAELMSSAKMLLGDSNAAAAAMIDSAMMLLEVDAAGNAASAVTILTTAKALL